MVRDVLTVAGRKKSPAVLLCKLDSWRIWEFRVKCCISARKDPIQRSVYMAVIARAVVRFQGHLIKWKKVQTVGLVECLNVWSRFQSVVAELLSESVD